MTFCLPLRVFTLNLILYYSITFSFLLNTCSSNIYVSLYVSTEIKCIKPIIENGYVTGDVTEYKEHEELDFMCNSKFKRSMERLPRCTKIGIRALWSPTPVCECKSHLKRNTMHFLYYTV